MNYIVNKDGVQEISKNTLRKGDIISIKKDGENIYRVAIILSKQVLFGGNFCVYLEKSFKSLPEEVEVQKEVSQGSYHWYFIDFYEALKDKRIFEIRKNFPYDGIFGGKIKIKEYLEDIDKKTGDFSYCSLNEKNRLTEQELEEYILKENGTITPILLDVISPQEVEETGTLELLAFQQDVVEKNLYFYSIKDIEKLDFSPETMIKPDFQTEEEKSIPEVTLVVDKIDSIL